VDYLAAETSNLTALDRQLTETYGESLVDVGGQRRVSKPNKIRLRKMDLPTIRIRMPQRSVVRAAAPGSPLALIPPDGVGNGEITVAFLDVGRPPRPDASCARSAMR